MTDTPQTNTDIMDYRLAVERHLADLPAPIREDLLNGLEEHLAEVSADLEPGVPLSHLLGSPEAYARELRETVEVPKGGVAERFRRAVLVPVTDRLKSASNRFARGAGLGDFDDLRKALKPAWWVLRGLIAAMLTWYLMFGTGAAVTYPVIRTELFIAASLIGAVLLFVWLSLRLGVRSQNWSRKYRVLVTVAGLYLLYGGWATFASSFIDDALFDTPITMTQSTTTDFDHAQDIYAYTEDGELLTDIYLFDEDGEPLMIGDPSSCEYEGTSPFAEETDLPGQGSPPYGYDSRYGYLYPLCMPDDDSTMLPEPEGAATSSPSPSGESSTTPVETPSGESPTIPTQD
ncbi:hypothetical protein [Glycomyces arizonensis]|uniref:hypothetical protein n=1 Tax=Glycomyces arizonensis TaxID=256035 RepID=UPI0004280982|nr:hypothetical protein [Glycomyces arizonensis]